MKNNMQSFCKKKSVRISAGALALILLAFFFMGGDTSEEVAATTDARTVTTLSVADYGAGALGTAVRAASGQAYLVRAESGGRVTKIHATGTVAAGAVVAELENSAQRAALTQAQGVYEAALAAAGGNVTGQATAKQDAVRTWNSATVGTAQVIYTSIDTYFTISRTTGSITGFRGLQAFGDAPKFNARRLALEETLKTWERDTATVTDTNVVSMLDTLDQDLAVIGTFIDDLAALVPQQQLSDSYTETQRSEDTARLSAARGTVTGIQRSVDAARTAIVNASGSNAAASNASVKQALGMVQSAQSAYDKTFVKTPVAGTVTAHSVKLGDIVNVGADIALITPSDTSATIATTFALPLTSVKYTPAGAYVFTIVDGKVARTQVETGLVTTSNISVSGLTGTEIIISDVRGLKEGDAVDSI